MATFDDQEVTDLAAIFTVTSDYMGQFLSIRDGIITETDKDRILADVTEHQAIENDNLSIEPRDRNFGARMSGDSKRSLIRQRIAGLIGWSTSTGSSASLVRG
jgi:hypothetical protein